MRYLFLLWVVIVVMLTMYSAKRNVHKSNCGPICLWNLLRTKKFVISMEQILNQFSDKNDYVSMAEIQEVAGNYGVKLEYENVKIEKLQQKSKTGIAYVDENHYVLIVSSNSDSVQVIDPGIDADKIVDYSYCDLKPRWRNAILSLN
jgi:ABC-type bacteriocin/lantibiotic exporter with double-glycine peptidase domain